MAAGERPFFIYILSQILSNMKITGIISTLQVHDLDLSIAFYQNLGFNIDWKWPEDSPSHASISSSGYSFMLEKIGKESIPEKADLYFRTEGVEQLHKVFADKNIEVGDLQKTDYGMLDFSIKSPNGHHLVFGEPSGEYQG